MLSRHRNEAQNSKQFAKYTGEAVGLVARTLPQAGRRQRQKGPAMMGGHKSSRQTAGSAKWSSQRPATNVGS
eukprot:scaffold452074_cov18-Prasinocladus_malaysianus.AAC.1